jgi:hypothetical protein
VTVAETMSGGRDMPVTAYEKLRTHVMTGSAAGGHSGLVVLLRQGVAAWMERRTACSAPVQPAPSAAPINVSDEIHAGLVRVLASMAMAGRQEART